MTSMGGGQQVGPMPEWQRKILRENRDDLVKDIDVNDIMNYMIQESILTTSQHERVMSHPTTIAKTEAFLDLLPKRGEKAFWAFLNVLEETYEFLYDVLKTAIDREQQQRNARMESEIYEDLDINTLEYTEPSMTGPFTQFDHPQSYVTPIVCHQGDSGLHNREVHPTVEVTADVTGDVVEKTNKQGNMYQGASSSETSLLSGSADASLGATATTSILDLRRPRIGNFTATGEKILIKKGSLAIVHNYFNPEGVAIIMYRVKLCCVPLYSVQDFGDPEREKWYSPIPLAPTQAEQMLRMENQEGLFLAYKPTYDSDITPYEISLRLSSNIVKHYPVYKFEQGQLGFKNEKIKFKNMKRLVEYHRQNRGILDCRLKRGLGELDEAVTFGKEWEIDQSEVDFEEGVELGSGYFGTLHQAMYRNKVVVVKKPNSDLKSKESIIDEAQVLMPLKHNNIACLLGIIRRDEPSLVTECLHDGDLRWWLENNASLDRMTRLHICQQVVAAVSYLHAQSPLVLHRAIAAHSCQVTGTSGNKVLIKLAGFPMARRVMDDCYNAEKDEKKAIRWSSPEVLNEGKYTTKSDVWSMGVFMWEVYSNGEKPFTSLTKNEVVRMVVEVKHSVISTDRPARCPREVSEIIERCFEYEPNDRPAASDVCDELMACKESEAGENHHLQPVDRSYALRQTMSYCDLTSSLDDCNLARNNPGRGGILNRLRRRSKDNKK